MIKCAGKCGRYATNNPNNNYDCECRVGYLPNPTAVEGCRSKLCSLRV